MSKGGFKKRLASGARIRRVSTRRYRENLIYSKGRKDYLRGNPLCEITMAQLRIDPREAYLQWQLQGGGEQLWYYWPPETGRPPVRIPRSTQIHHRNRRNGSRLNRQEFWMATCADLHEWAERNPSEARKIGVTCPVNAWPDGMMADGSQCLTTHHLLYLRAYGSDATTSPPVEVTVS